MIKLAVGEVFDPLNYARKLIRSYPQLLNSTTIKSSYIKTITASGNAKGFDLTLMVKSLKRINKDIEYQENRLKISKKQATKDDAEEEEEKLKRQKIRSAVEGSRLASLDVVTSSYPDAKVMILGTDATNPRDSHAFIEGDIMSITQANRYLSEFGCRHTFKIVDLG